MTTTIVYTSGEVKTFVIEGGENHHDPRLYNRAGMSVVIFDVQKKNKYIDGPHVSIRLQDGMANNNVLFRFANESRKGEELGLPNVKSIAHKSGAKER